MSMGRGRLQGAGAGWRCLALLHALESRLPRLQRAPTGCRNALRARATARPQIFTLLGLMEFLPSSEILSLLDGQLCRIEPHVSTGRARAATLHAAVTAADGKAAASCQGPAGTSQAHGRAACHFNARWGAAPHPRLLTAFCVRCVRPCSCHLVAAAVRQPAGHDLRLQPQQRGPGPPANIPQLHAVGHQRCACACLPPCAARPPALSSVLRSLYTPVDVWLRCV